MTEVNIYELSKTQWQKAMPKLLEQVISRNNNKVHVLCDDENYMQELDDLLWTFEQLAFVPHATYKDKQLESNPIVLSVNDNINNKANILVITGTKIPSNLQAFEKIIIMYQNTDKIRRDMVNNHCKKFNELNIKCNFFKQNGVGSWERSMGV